MNKILFLTIAFFAIQMISAQETTKVESDSIYNTAGIEVKPDFPGGMGEFYKYFAKNYRTPNVKKLNGKVYVTFVIERDGSIVDIKVLRDIGYGTGEEAIRVLNNSPKWLPGEQDGKKVRCSFTLPITIDTR
jgi:protein TonB